MLVALVTDLSVSNITVMLRLIIGVGKIKNSETFISICVIMFYDYDD